MKGGVPSFYSIYVVIIVLGGVVAQVVSACAYQHASVVKAMGSTTAAVHRCALTCPQTESKTSVVYGSLFYSQFTERDNPCDFVQLSGGRHQPLSCYIDSCRHPNAYKTKAQAPFVTILIVFCRYITTVPVDWNRLIYTGRIKPRLTEVAVTHTAHYSTYT